MGLGSKNFNAPIQSRMMPRLIRKNGAAIRCAVVNKVSMTYYSFLKSHLHQSPATGPPSPKATEWIDLGVSAF